jgi:hypothetical protein
MNEDDKSQLQDFLNDHDGIHDAICSAISWYYECNPEAEQPTEGEENEWVIKVGDFLDEND